MSRLHLLQNHVQHYDWGSKSAIPALLGCPNFEELPWAEFWMGAHPKSPSQLELDGVETPLDAACIQRPLEFLGDRVLHQLGPNFPFLFKILSADRPLSLQAHPDADQAAAGFAEEDDRGIPRDDPARCYRDPRPKPELLVALSSFTALKGFRTPADILQTLEKFQLTALDPLRAQLEANPSREGLKGFVSGILGLSDSRAAITQACSKGVPWIEALNAHYPRDPAALCPLFLEVITLAPGEGIYLGPRELHAYLRGTGLEIMANSDNVLRAGLTTKHVDLGQLLSVLDYGNRPLKILPPKSEGSDRRWETPAREFQLTHIKLGGQRPPPSIECWGPKIILALDGLIELEDQGSGERLTLEQGESALLVDAVRDCALRGLGSAYLASVPQHD